MELTPKQQRFCEEYLVDLNGTQAAIRAGYAPRSANVTAASLLTKTNIQQRIQTLRNERTRKLKIDAEWVLRQLVKTYRHCSAAVPVTDQLGEPTGEYRFDSKGALRALELVGKHIGFFPDPRIKITGDQSQPIPFTLDLTGLSDAELTAYESLLAKIAAAGGTGPGAIGTGPAKAE